MKSLIVIITLLLSSQIYSKEPTLEEWRLNFRNELFDPSVGFDWLGLPTEDFDQKLIWGAQKIYCAHTANILDQSIAASRLYEKGLSDLDGYASKLALRGADSTKHNFILNFAKPPYIKNKDVIKGMIIQKIISTINDQFYTLGSESSKRKNDLKIFYLDNCSNFL